MTIRLYDTATREVRDFRPLEEGKAGIYVCGLTVQSEPHVGHVRSAVNFDVLRRWLTHQGYAVTFIRNVTDIDDKILAKADEQGRPWFNLAYEMHGRLTEALAAINVLPPTYEPAATGHVPEMLELIADADRPGPRLRRRRRLGRRLLRRALVAVVRRAHRPEGRRHGGRRRRRPARQARPARLRALEGLQEGARAGDGGVALARTARVGPGWHIECSAMAGKYLGRAFDIHGGGVDLRFPHHENEQAQSRAAGQAFASYWMHNAWITTAGEKMSKSLGNSLQVPKVLERVRGIELRFYMVSAHYRSHVEFSFEALDEAAVGFRRIETFLDKAGPGEAGEVPAGVRRGDGRRPRHAGGGRGALRHRARGQPRRRPRTSSRTSPPRCARCSACSVSTRPTRPGAAPASDDAALTAAVDALVAGLLEQRAEARAAKDFARADLIRDQIKAAGIEVEDTPTGPKWSLI